MAKFSDGWQHFDRRMTSSLLRPVAQVALLGSLCVCVGCGATGLDWVGEAHLESASLQRVNAAHASSSVSTASISAVTEPLSQESRPRLSHTVTLGEIDVAPATAEAGQGAAPGPSVIVNNYNQVNVGAPALGYGYYGYSRNPAGFSPGRVTPYPSSPSTSGPLPGQNWPAVADHGPSFPYATSPAPTWTRTR